MVNGGFKLKGNRTLFCDFAPAGRDVYRPATLYLNGALHRSAMSS